MQLIDEARANNVVDKLYRQVEAVTPIVLVESSENTWGSATQNGQTTIEVAPTAFPQESLYHELLHAQLKINGYLQYRNVMWDSPMATAAHSLLGPLDNELQHHRMYNQFVSDGFDGLRFYCDDDVNSFRDVRKELNNLKVSEHPALFLLQWLTIIAPGGHGTDGERQKLRNLMRARAGKTTFGKLEKIEHLIRQWGASPAVDPGPIIVDILDALEGFKGCWIGYGSNYPSQGLVV